MNKMMDAPKLITEWSALYNKNDSYRFPNWNTIALSTSVDKSPDCTITALDAATVIEYAAAAGMDTILCIERAIMVYPDKVYTLA